MNKLELKEVTQRYAVYFYYPEGSELHGEIRMDFGADEADIVSRSNNDDSGRYAFNAAKAVRECFLERNFPLSFMQAWN